MGGRPTRKTAADPFEIQKLSRSEEFRKQEDSRTEPPLRFLAALECAQSEDRSVNRILRRLKLQTDRFQSAHCALHYRFFG